MHSKGAIFIDETKSPKEIHPVPILEYLQLIENNFNKNKITLENELTKYASKSPREGIFQIDSVKQAIEKAKQLITDANSVIMIDATTPLLTTLKKILEKRASDGIMVLIKAYEPIEINGCHIVFTSDEYRTIDWDDQWCNIISDEKEFLISVFENDINSVLQAIWSKSEYLSITIISGFLHEFVLARISSLILDGTPSEKLIDELKKLYKKYIYDLAIIKNVKNVIINK